MLTVTSLFSGIGGIDLGLEQTGYFKTTLFSEIDPYCQKILRQHWPNVTIIPDVKDIDGKKIKSDVIVGGFPCQPFSVAGKRKGKDDQRHLWPEMFRIIKDAKPSIVIGENVPGIINVQMALGSCISDLESEGYNVQCFVLPASAVGAPHRRYRVFIIALANTECLGWKERAKKREKSTDKETSNQSDNSSTRQRKKEANKTLANTDSIRCSRYKEPKKETSRGRTKTSIMSGSKNVSNTNSEGLQGYGQSDSLERKQKESIAAKSYIETNRGWWSVEPNVGRVAHGVPDRVDRTKALGNAVIPQLAYAIGISIIKSIKGE